MRDMCHHKRHLEKSTLPFRISQDEEIVDKPKETLYHVITYRLEQDFQRSKNFVILILYEKVMPILVNLFNPQRRSKVYPPQSFALFSKRCEIPKRDLTDKQMKCLIFYL